MRIHFAGTLTKCRIKAFSLLVFFNGLTFSLIIVFSFIVLKYIWFCCHSSHSVLSCICLVYSRFILFVKSDSNFNLNSSRLLFKSFHICLLYFFVYRLFFLFISYSFYLFFFFISFCLSCSFAFLVFSCYSVFFCHSVSFFFFLSHFFPPIFLSFLGFIFTFLLVYFLIFLREYLSI